MFANVCISLAVWEWKHPAASQQHLEDTVTWVAPWPVRKSSLPARSARAGRGASHLVTWPYHSVYHLHLPSVNEHDQRPTTARQLHERLRRWLERKLARYGFNVSHLIRLSQGPTQTVRPSSSTSIFHQRTLALSIHCIRPADIPDHLLAAPARHAPPTRPGLVSVACVLFFSKSVGQTRSATKCRTRLSRRRLWLAHTIVQASRLATRNAGGLLQGRLVQSCLQRDHR